MKRRSWQGITALGMLGLGLAGPPGRALGQVAGLPLPPTSSVAPPGVVSPFLGGAGMAGNPYMNPYANPFINPYATQQQMTAGNAALYFMSAQQLNGGIGSGRLGGPRAGSASAATAKAGSNLKAPEARRAGGANTPGASASRYFDRATPTNLNASTARFYNRQSRHFPANGH